MHPPLLKRWPRKALKLSLEPSIYPCSSRLHGLIAYLRTPSAQHPCYHRLRSLPPLEPMLEGLGLRLLVMRRNSRGAMMIVQSLTMVALSIIVRAAHHVHGVHVGAVAGSAPMTAFQLPHCERRQLPLAPSPRSVASRLGYSTDGDRIDAWLQPNTAKISDDLHINSDDLSVSYRSGRVDDCDGEEALDDWTADTAERRKRRLLSLERFNQYASQPNDNRGQGEAPAGVSRGDRNEGKSLSDQIELPHNDLSQLQAIQSNAPAILLPSGPGTGKSHVLSLRIAYLLQKHVRRMRRDAAVEPSDDEHVRPDSMVILSFTNRDAERLKERALDCLFPQSVNVDFNMQQWRNETSRQLWAGTMHAFSLAILNKYGGYSTLRVLPAREMRNRVSVSLRTLLNVHDGDGSSPDKRELQSRHLNALNDVGHSRSILHQNIVRCIELWKEANMPLTPPEPASVHSEKYGLLDSVEQRTSHGGHQEKEVQVRKACLELAMRLGIPESSATLALDVFPEYQARHAAAGTADPADLAGMAFRLLVDQPSALRLLRSKLKHIIVDEYQDMSVSQHALLRLVVRGVVNEHETSASRRKRKEQRRRRRLPVLLEPGDHKRTYKAISGHTREQSYSVPSIFAAGDASQSIYGWRGGAPELTVHGFRRDYPQGIIAPLSTCYRLPNDIVDAAAMLLPMELEAEESFDWTSEGSDSYEVSPAAAAKIASSVMRHPTAAKGPLSSEEKVRLGNQLLLSKGMQRLDSTVMIRGLWDSREEAKHIAYTIRRRAKERRQALIAALRNFGDDVPPSMENELKDLTDVAVMVRSSAQLHLIKEALDKAGVPFVGDDIKDFAPGTADDGGSQSWPSPKRGRSVKTIPMKPVSLMTMHRSKGEEFDDVYLAGWNEGEFPHPSMSSNRVHEERRLAFVALTRARQRVVITHSFMKRTLYYGKDGMKKFVTEEVQPSRFLYELVPSERHADGATVDGGERKTKVQSRTVWDRSSGVKDYVVGQDAPNFFQKAYEVPNGYVSSRSDVRPLSTVDMTRKMSVDSPAKQAEDKNVVSQKTPIQVVEAGLKELVAERKKGASKKYNPIFRQMLKSFFQIHRGNALVFASGAKSKQTQNESIYALIEAKPDELVSKPIGKCTATQLGHYLAYRILKPELSSQAGGPIEAHSNNRSEGDPLEDALHLIEGALHDIVVVKKDGASKKHTPVFKSMLKSFFQIHRGNALVFASGAKSKQTQNESVDALIEAKPDELVSKPIGKCTATQLGHYLAYRIITSGRQDNT